MLILPPVASYPYILRKKVLFFNLDPMILSRVVAWRRYIITKEAVNNVGNMILAVSVGFETLDGHPENAHPSQIQHLSQESDLQLH